MKVRGKVQPPRRSLRRYIMHQCIRCPPVRSHKTFIACQHAESTFQYVGRDVDVYTRASYYVKEKQPWNPSSYVPLPFPSIALDCITLNTILILPCGAQSANSFHGFIGHCKGTNRCLASTEYPQQLYSPTADARQREKTRSARASSRAPLFDVLLDTI